MNRVQDVVKQREDSGSPSDALLRDTLLVSTQISGAFVRGCMSEAYRHDPCGYLKLLGMRY